MIQEKQKLTDSLVGFREQEVTATNHYPAITLSFRSGKDSLYFGFFDK